MFTFCLFQLPNTKFFPYSALKPLIYSLNEANWRWCMHGSLGCLAWNNSEKYFVSQDSLRQVRRLGGVLLRVWHKSANMFLTYTIYTPKVEHGSALYLTKFKFWAKHCRYQVATNSTQRVQALSCKAVESVWRCYCNYFLSSLSCTIADSHARFIKYCSNKATVRRVAAPLY